MPGVRLHAAVRYYDGPTDGSWVSPSNWYVFPSGTGEPVSGDDAYLSNYLTTSFGVNFDTPSTPLLNSISVETTNATGSMNLSIAQGHLRTNTDYIGSAGVASITHSAGSHTASTTYLGYAVGSSGTYDLGGTGRLTINSEMYVGYASTGYFLQSGGTVSFSNGASLVLGFMSGSSGYYMMSGGTMNASIILIGDDASAQGQFNQSGGIVTLNGRMSLASYSPGSTGSYGISGLSQLNVTGTLSVGDRGTGSFVHSGGTVRVNASGTNGLLIGVSGADLSGGPALGTYTLSGGLLSVTGRVAVALAGNGTFSQTGGQLQVNGTLEIAASTGLGAAAADFSITGGSLSASSIVLNPGGRYTQGTGATSVTFTSFTMNGGTAAGTVTSPGAFTYNAGTFSGRLVTLPGSSLALNADLLLGNGMSNGISLSLGSNRTITFDGAGLSNSASINLQGGVIAGAGPLINSGTLIGPGTISGTGGFTNTSTVNVPLGTLRLLNSGANQNAGTLNIPAAALPGGSLILDDSTIILNNTGTLAIGTNGSIIGTGNLINKSTGVINTSDATVSCGLSNQGTINVGSAGVGNLAITPNFVNSGSIVLTGSNVQLSGGIIANSGTISGSGVIGNAVDNTGLIAANPGQSLQLSGLIHNQAGGVVTVAPGGTMIASFSTNAGTLNINGPLTANSFTNTGQINIKSTFDPDQVVNSGGITFSAATIDALCPITNNPGGNITLAAPAANVTFYHDINHNPGAAINIQAGTANFLGNITGGGAVSNSGSISLASSKTFTLGEISGNGSTSVLNSAHLATPRLTQSTLQLSAGAKVTLSSAPAAGQRTSKVTTLTLAGDSTPAARLDLTNNNLVVDYIAASPLAMIQAQILSAYNGGAWSGDGITSSAAASDPGTALGFAEASHVLGLTGDATANWFGQTVDATSVLIRFTRNGDSDLDGTVGFSDLVAVAQNYENPAPGLSWFTGDFNYDGIVGFDDLVVIAQNYQTSLPAPGSPAFESLPQSMQVALTQVPEPGTGTMGLLGAMLLTRRRRFKQNGTSLTARPSRPRPSAG